MSFTFRGGAAAFVLSTLMLAGCATTSPVPAAPSQTPTPEEPAMELAAAWLDAGRMIGLVTWGSSSCRPQVAGIEETADGITVNFTPHDGMCTMDMAPR